MPDLPEFLRTDDRPLWLLIGLCLAMIFTIQAVETAVEGAWPHQRRPTRLLPHERTAQAIWGVVALLVLPGGLLVILNVAVIVWKDLTRPETLTLGGLLLGVGWLVFVLGSIDGLRVRPRITSIGAVVPFALLALLMVGDILLLISFIEIRPSIDSVRDALPALAARSDSR